MVSVLRRPLMVARSLSPGCSRWALANSSLSSTSLSRPAQTTSLAQIDLVQQTPTVIGQGNQMAADRIRKTWHVEIHIGHHAGLHFIDSREICSMRLHQ